MWSIYERILLQNGVLERPIGDSELVVGATAALRKGKQLTLKPNPAKTLIADSEADIMAQGWLYHKTMDAGWKRMFCVCEPPQLMGGPPTLSCFKDALCAHPAGQITIDGALLYYCSAIVSHNIPPFFKPLPNILI